MSKPSERKRRKTPGVTSVARPAKDKAPPRVLEPTMRLDEAAPEPAANGRVHGTLDLLLQQADRRLFPSMPPLQYAPPADDLSLDEVLTPAFDEDPAPLTQWPSDEFDTVTSLHRPDGDGSRPFLTDIFRRHTPSGRSLTYTDAGFIAVLWQSWQAGASVRISLYAEGEPPWTLTLHHSTMLSMEGPVARWTVRRLVQEGVLTATAEDERECLALLHRHIELGHLGVLDVERGFRRAREEALARLVRSPVVHLSLHELSEATHARPLPPRLLGRGLLGSLFEAARLEIPSAMALNWLGDTQRCMHLGAQTALDMQLAELQPEVAAYLLASNGMPLHRILSPVAASEGLATVVYLLHVVESLVLR